MDWSAEPDPEAMNSDFYPVFTKFTVIYYSTLKSLAYVLNEYTLQLAAIHEITLLSIRCTKLFQGPYDSELIKFLQLYKSYISRTKFCQSQSRKFLPPKLLLFVQQISPKNLESFSLSLSIKRKLLSPIEFFPHSGYSSPSHKSDRRADLPSNYAIGPPPPRLVD